MAGHMAYAPEDPHRMIHPLPHEPVHPQNGMHGYGSPPPHMVHSPQVHMGSPAPYSPYEPPPPVVNSPGPWANHHAPPAHMPPHPVMNSPGPYYPYERPPLVVNSPGPWANHHAPPAQMPPHPVINSPRNFGAPSGPVIHPLEHPHQADYHWQPPPQAQPFGFASPPPPPPPPPPPHHFDALHPGAYPAPNPPFGYEDDDQVQVGCVFCLFIPLCSQTHANGLHSVGTGAARLYYCIIRMRGVRGLV